MRADFELAARRKECGEMNDLLREFRDSSNNLNNGLCAVAADKIEDQEYEIERQTNNALCLHAQVEELKNILDLAKNALTCVSDVYTNSDDEAGECAFCHERSYKPHALDCKKMLALNAMERFYA